MQPQPTDPPGVWQAWVADGATEAQRDARLAMVPEAIRVRVEQHLRTVRALETYRVKMLGKK